MAILRDPGTAGKRYELGGPQVYTFRELMELLLAVIGRRSCLVSLPFGLASMQAAILEKLPNAPLTRDQVELLRRDNIRGGERPEERRAGKAGVGTGSNTG